MNSGVVLWTRAELRRRWPAVLLLSALVAVAGGAAIAAAAGARRTDSAFGRLVASTHAASVEVNSPDFNDLDPAIAAEAMTLPGVRGATTYAFMGIAPEGFPNYIAIAVVEERGVKSRPVMVEGDRIGDLSALPANVVLLNEAMQHELDAHVHDVLQLHTLTPEQFAESVDQTSDMTPAGPSPTVTVLGIGRDPEDVSDAPDPFLMLPPAFYAKYRDQIGGCVCAVQIRTDPDQVDAVIGRLRTLHPDVRVDRTDDYGARIQDTVSLQRRTWWVIAAVAAAAAVVASYLTARRVARLVMVDEDTRRALGFSPRDRLVSRFGVMLPAAPLGAAGALGVAYLLSPLAPVGLTRLAEPSPGLRWDATALLWGTAVVLAGAGSVLVGAAAGSQAGARRLHGPAAQGGPAIALGNRLAIGPGRSAMLVVTFAVGGLVGALTLEHSVHRVLVTPSLFGADFDASNTLDSGDDKRSLAAQVAPDPDIDAVALVWSQLPSAVPISVTGPSGQVAVSPSAFESVKGVVSVRSTRGREPGSADEAALGDQLMARLHVGIGDRITVTGDKGTQALTVVGNDLDPGVDIAGNGFAMTHDGLDRLTGSTIQGAVFRVRRGADRTAVMARYAPLGFTPVTAPSEILHVGQLGGLPMRVGELLTLLGVIGLINTVVLTLKTGRREVALHRALGFTGAQVLRSHLWQFVVIAVLGATVGGCVGFVVGRAIERQLVRDVGAIATTVLPASVWSVGAAAVGVCCLAGFTTGALALRRRAGAELRAE